MWKSDHYFRNTDDVIRKFAIKSKEYRYPMKPLTKSGLLSFIIVGMQKVLETVTFLLVYQSSPPLSRRSTYSQGTPDTHILHLIWKITYAYGFSRAAVFTERRAMSSVCSHSLINASHIILLVYYRCFFFALAGRKKGNKAANTKSVHNLRFLRIYANWVHLTGLQLSKW